MEIYAFPIVEKIIFLHANLNDDPCCVCRFPNMSVRHVTKKRVVDILTERIIESYKVNQMVMGFIDENSTIEIAGMFRLDLCNIA